MKYFTFDIETGPDEKRLKYHLENTEFRAKATLKDPFKIAEDIKKKKQDATEKAALDAKTGEILAIGIGKQCEGGGLEVIFLDNPDEKEILKDFWSFINTTIYDSKWIGFNSEGFDIPFLIRRTYMHGLSKLFPPELNVENIRYNRDFIDLMILWNFGDRHKFTSLNSVATALGVGGKMEGMTGADFAPMFKDPTTRDKALAYLAQDIIVTWNCAVAMNQIKAPATTQNTGDKFFLRS